MKGINIVKGVPRKWTKQGIGVRSSFLTKCMRKTERDSTYFGIGESFFSWDCRRVKDKIRKDKKLERKIKA